MIFMQHARDGIGGQITDRIGIKTWYIKRLTRIDSELQADRVNGIKGVDL